MRVDAGEALALCVVISRRGSTLKKRGLIKLVLASGCVEAQNRMEAPKLLHHRRTSKLIGFHLDQD